MILPISSDPVTNPFLCNNKVLKSDRCQLLTQTIHIHRKRIFVHIRIVLPKLRHKRIARYDLLLILKQCLQDAKFILRQFQLLILIR